VPGLRLPSQAVLEASTPPATPSRTPARPLKVVFGVERGAILRFALLLPELAERGHEVHVAFVLGAEWRTDRPPELPPRTQRLIDELCERYPNIHYGFAPQREGAGWYRVAWLSRALADLAHNADPRYTGADVLRRRTKKRILGRLEKGGDFEPLSRRLFLRSATQLTKRTDAELSARMLRVAASLEDAVPSSREVDRYLRELDPDVVVVTGTFRHVSSEVELLKSARRLGIPAGIFVTSWDNLTNKGSLKFVPERVFLWNDVQARDAVELHRIPQDRIRLTGAHVFDEWFERRPSRTREELLAEIGLDPSEPYLVYLCSSRNVARPSEVEFVRSWVEAIRGSGDERLRRIGILVRPHPNADVQWQGVELPGPNAVVWPRTGAHPVAEQARADFFDTLAHSAAVVGINTTAMIEAAILGKTVLTVLVPEFAQETTLHFHNLKVENGGFLHVAADLEEHVGQLASVLVEDEAGAERRRAFVESFVRPAGVDRPAAPVGAAAIEELAEAEVRRGTRPRTVALRGVLALDAGANAAYAALRRGGSS
jgi:hypothetical protein